MSHVRQKKHQEGEKGVGLEKVKYSGRQSRRVVRCRGLEKYRRADERRGEGGVLINERRRRKSKITNSARE